MIYATITVSGLGGIISYEMELIRRALEASGIEVEVVNAHPMTDQFDSTKHRYTGTVDEQIEQIRANMIKSREAGNVHLVRLVAKHEPWGG